MKLEYFLDKISKNDQISNFMKIRPLGAELLYGDKETDGRTHEEANSRFRQFCESAPKPNSTGEIKFQKDTTHEVH